MDLVRFDQAASQQIFQILTKAALESLSAGDILQGRVQSLDNGLLLIKLLDGSAFSAKVPEGFSASAGELITLEIGERQNDQLTARIVSMESGQTKAGSTGDESAQTIARNLISLGAVPTDKLVNDVLSLLKAEPDLPSGQAAFLAGNKIEPDPETLKILQKISENEFKLTENLQSLKDGLIQGLTQTEDGTRQAVLKPLVVSEALDGLSQELGKMLSKVQPETKDAVIQNVRELLIRLLLDETAGKAGEAASVKTPILDGKALEDLLQSALNEAKKPGGFESETIRREAANLSEEGNPLLASGEGPKPLSASETDQLLKLINKTLEDVHTKTAGQTKADAKEIEALLDKFFDKAFIKAGNGEVQTVDIKEKAEALKKVMDFVDTAMSRMDGQSQEASLPAFKEIDQAFRFFNQVTTYDSILQMPIKMNQENTTGELYVMRRKQHKKLDNDNFTLFLSLQTANLGLIESFLNTSHKCVTASFRVEDEDLVGFIKNQHRAFYNGLLKKGYKLAEMKCSVLEDGQTGILNAAAKARELLGLEAKVDLRI